MTLVTGSAAGNSRLSIVITAFNEGADLLATLQSIRNSTDIPLDIVIVDDASTDGCSSSTGRLYGATVIRHNDRLGVGSSRDEAAEYAAGACIAFLDGHQSLTDRCLDACLQMASDKQAVVCPDIQGFDRQGDVMHGACFDMSPNKPPFGAKWRNLKPQAPVNRISSLKAPAYVIPAEIYPKLRWSRLLRGWGGSEGSVSLKAFFTDTPILHLCGPIAYHKFKKTFHYEVTWDEIWRNHALIARICFSEATWYDYWLPEVFGKHLSEVTQQEMDSDAVKAEHLEFQQIKVRPDHEFWTRLTFQKIPPAVKR